MSPRSGNLLLMPPIVKRVGTRKTKDGVDFGYTLNDGPFVVTSSILCSTADSADAAKIGGTV